MLTFPPDSIATSLTIQGVNSSTVYNGSTSTFHYFHIDQSNPNSVSQIWCNGSLLMQSFGVNDDLHTYNLCSNLTISKTGQDTAYYYIIRTPGFNTSTKIKTEMTNGDILIGSMLFLGLGLFLAYAVLHFTRYYKLARLN